MSFSSKGKVGPRKIWHHGGERNAWWTPAEKVSDGLSFDGLFHSIEVGNQQTVIFHFGWLCLNFLTCLHFPFCQRPFLWLPIVGDDPGCSRTPHKDGRLSRRVAIFDAPKVTNRKQAEGNVWSQAIGSCFWAGWNCMFTRMWWGTCSLSLSNYNWRATNMNICTHTHTIYRFFRSYRARLYPLAKLLEMTMEREMYILKCIHASAGIAGFWWISSISQVLGQLFHDIVRDLRPAFWGIFNGASKECRRGQICCRQRSFGDFWFWGVDWGGMGDITWFHDISEFGDPQISSVV